MQRLRCLTGYLAGWVILSVAAHAQEQDNRTDPPRVFLDCAARCDEDFFRDQITLVDYVRDRRDADVHVILTSQPTGGGGLEYTVQFIGAGRFPGVNQTLTYAAPESSTADERRSALAEVLKRGLVRYIAETGVAERIAISFTPQPAVDAKTDGAGDPWNLWVFRTTVTGTFSGESLTSGRSVRLGASASRTSEAWRLSMSSTASYRDDRFDLGEQTFRSISRAVALNTLAVKSLTSHWSAGVVASASSSTFLNYDLRVRAAPGLEYNVFPYSQSTRRMLTLQYTVGVNSFDYREETIFGRLSERLVDHRLAVLLTLVRPWGSAATEATLLQFVGKPDKYNLGIVAQSNVRIAKGLSLNAFVTISRTRDQLYLPKADATLEAILVRQQQLATSYRYSTAFGVTYTFGSIFNNIVNPRFGRGGDDLSDF